MKSVYCCSLILVLGSLSFPSVAMNSNSNLFKELDRLQKELKDSEAEFDRFHRNLGMESFFAKSAKQAGHAEFIALPNELKERSLLHVSCDCKNLVPAGHYCGSHALAHAVDIAQTHDIIKSSESPDLVIKKEFARLNVGSSPDAMTSTQNIMKIADNLNLDHLFTVLKNDNLEAVFTSPYERPLSTAQNKLELMRFDLINNGKGTIKHVFAIYEVANEMGKMENHVVLFSIIADDSGLSITLHDNLNQPIKKGTPLFTFADRLIKFFLEVNKEQVAYEYLVNVLAQAHDRYRYLEKLKRYSRIADSNNLIEHLFSVWVVDTKQTIKSMKEPDVTTLNAALKPLKLLMKVQPQSIAKELIIKTYGAMVDCIHDHQGALEKKISLTESVIKAIKKSSTEQKIFSFKTDQDAGELFEKAQNLLTSLKSNY